MWAEGGGGGGGAFHSPAQTGMYFQILAHWIMQQMSSNKRTVCVYSRLLIMSSILEWQYIFNS